MHQFRIVVPAHVKGGEIIRIQYPDGTGAHVRVPDGLLGGDSFIYDKRGFLDREIVTMQDCCVAVGVGLAIGFAVVIGFLWGVLAVTDPHQLQASSFVATSATNYNNMVGSATTTPHLTRTDDATTTGAILYHQVGGGTLGLAAARQDATNIPPKEATGKEPWLPLKVTEAHMGEQSPRANASEPPESPRATPSPPPNRNESPESYRSLSLEERIQLQQFWQEQLILQTRFSQPPTVQQQQQQVQQQQMPLLGQEGNSPYEQSLYRRDTVQVEL